LASQLLKWPPRLVCSLLSEMLNSDTLNQKLHTKQLKYIILQF
jgi:hypothetical protein